MVRYHAAEAKDFMQALSQRRAAFSAQCQHFKWPRDAAHQGQILGSRVHLLSALSHLACRPTGRHVEFDKQVVPTPPGPQTFAEDVHWQSKEAEEDRRASEDVHDLLRTLGGHPIVGEVGETIKHEVLSESA
jgi:hypothetical protein